MNRIYSILRRLFKWSGVFGCVTLAAVYVGTSPRFSHLWVGFTVRLPYGGINVFHGRATFYWAPNDRSVSYDVLHGLPLSGEWSAPKGIPGVEWRASQGCLRGAWSIAVSLWLVVMAVAIPTVALLVWDRRADATRLGAAAAQVAVRIGAVACMCWLVTWIALSATHLTRARWVSHRFDKRGACFVELDNGRPEFVAVLDCCQGRIAMPGWLPFAVFAIPTSLLWWNSRRQVPGRCVKCGYDLRGLPKPRCPECATPFEIAITPDGEGCSQRSVR